MSGDIRLDNTCIEIFFILRLELWSMPHQRNDSTLSIMFLNLILFYSPSLVRILNHHGLELQKRAPESWLHVFLIDGLSFSLPVIVMSLQINRQPFCFIFMTSTFQSDGLVANGLLK